MPTGRIVYFDRTTRRGRLVCLERSREFPFSADDLDDPSEIVTGQARRFQILTSDRSGAIAVCLQPVS